MEHFKDNSGCSGPKKSEIFWNNSRKVQYVFAGVVANFEKKRFEGSYTSYGSKFNSNIKALIDSVWQIGIQTVA